MEHRSGVPCFFSSDASVNLEAIFENSLVLTDSAGLGRLRIEAGLCHQMPQRNWVARYYDDSRFLIKAPDPQWLQMVTTRGTLHVENVDLPATHWDSAMDEGARLRPVWVQVRGFPMKLWFFHEFAHLFEQYGQVLALNPDIAGHIDNRVARVRVGICVDRHIPPMDWTMYCDNHGFWTQYDVSFEVEQAPVHHHLSPSRHPPPPKGNNEPGYRKNRGRWHDPGAGSSSARA